MIKMLVMDVDGTLTDGNLYYGNGGEIVKKFNVKDGYGIKLLTHSGVIPVILSARNSSIVRVRFEELGVSEIHLGIEDKYSKLKGLVTRYNIKLSEVAYVGDDENDLLSMRNVGFPFAIKNSIKEIKLVSLFISELSGGNGAVRDIIDYILRKNNEDK